MSRSAARKKRLREPFRPVEVMAGCVPSPPKPFWVILTHPPHRFRRDPVRFGIIEVWPQRLHSAGRGPEAVMRLAFKDASCMAVGSSCGAVEDEGRFGGRHPDMFAFCSCQNKAKVVAGAREIGVGLGSLPDSGPILGHSRSTFSSRISRPKSLQCGCAIQVAHHQR